MIRLSGWLVSAQVYIVSIGRGTIHHAAGATPSDLLSIDYISTLISCLAREYSLQFFPSRLDGVRFIISMVCEMLMCSIIDIDILPKWVF